MKLTTSSVLCLFATGAYSAALDTRDLGSIQGVLAQVQKGIDGLTNAFKGSNGNVQPVVDASNQLLGTIEAGTKTVGASPVLSVFDSPKLLGPVQEMEKHAQALDGTIKDSITKIEEAKGCGIARTQLAKMSTESQSLIDTLVSRVSDGLYRNIAKTEANKFTATIADISNSLAVGKCNDA